MEHLISIIIPVYNRATLISETLTSIMEQSYSNWECITIDDGSEDDTINVVSAFAKAESRISIHKRPFHLPKGANTCRNYGYTLSKGTYVMFYDSDDAMLPFKLETHINGFENYNGIDGFTLNSAYFNFETKNAYRKWRPQLWSERILQDFLLQEAGWQTGDVLWLKSSLEHLRFSQDLQSYQDYDFHARALLKGKTLKYNDVIASHIRHTPASIKLTKNKETLISEWKARYRTINEALKLNRIDHEFAQKILPSLYKIMEQLVSINEYRYFFSSLGTLYKVSSIAGQRRYFFKKMSYTYPRKLI